MAFRGRGRGRFGGGGFGYAKQEPFVLFPDIELPPRIEASGAAKSLVSLDSKFRKYVQNSPYFLEETLENNEGTVDIERYSDKVKKRSVSNLESISSCGYMILDSEYFPKELVRGTKRRTVKKIEWNPRQDFKKLDMLERLEEKFKDDDPKSKNKGEDGEDEEDKEEEPSEEEDEDGDYAQNIDFDDDEDDYNQSDSGGEEDTL